MLPPEEITISSVLRWITLQTLAVLALVVPTTWFFADYFYNTLGIVAANDTRRTVEFIIGLGVVETILFCPVMIIPISVTMLRLEATRRELGRLASTDALTGLLNRRGFEAAVAARIASAPAESIAAIFACDIDFFKLANDLHGHHFGDRALTELGAFIAEAVRPYGGIAARFGGEEFVVFVLGLPAHEIAALAQAVRIGFQNQPIELDGVRAHFTVSIGVASTTDPVDLVRLIDSADNALYAAKRAGRNCVKSVEKTYPKTAA